MRVSIMQPYYVPYVTYFELIDRSDCFVLYDDVQYIKNGWINRNRIRSPKSEPGWAYLTIPTSVPGLASTIRDARTAPPGNWPSRHLAQVREAFGKRALESPLCRAIHDEPRDVGIPLVETLERLLRVCCSTLGIETPIVRSSAIELPGGLRGQERVLAICERLGATRYINLPGGRSLYDPSDFERRGLTLEFLPELTYRSRDGAINPFSILDLCLWDGPEAVRGYLDDRRREPASRSAA